MNQDEVKTKSDLAKSAQQLLDDIRETNQNFAKKTDQMIKDIDLDIRKSGQEFAKIERELNSAEKDTIKKMDRTVLDFLTDEDSN